MKSPRIKTIEKQLKEELMKTTINNKRVAQLKASLRQAIIEERYSSKEK